MIASVRQSPAARGDLYTSEPPVWFHDIFRANGSAYIPKEVDYIRTVTGKTVKQN